MMNYYIIIPAHNEDAFIGLTLESIATQTHLPKKVVIVNDNSTDNTETIIQKFANQHPWASWITISSVASHLPGSKVIQAFQKGLAFFISALIYLMLQFLITKSKSSIN